VLEEKLDGIVQMLQRSQQVSIDRSQDSIQSQNYDFEVDRNSVQSRERNGIFHCDGGMSSNGGTPGNRENTIGNLLVPMTNERMHLNQTNSKVAQGPHCTINGPPTPASSTTGNFTGQDIPKDYPLETKAELEECLNNYREKMVPNFPVVCIGPDVTVEELRNERPFLFLVIRAIGSKKLVRQTALILQIKKMLGREMLLEGTRNLDLLLGVLVFAAWCHFYICEKPIISTIIQLGMSLAFDLGLTRPLPAEPLHVMSYYNAQGCPRPVNGGTMRTMEERRAAVGLFFVSSV
jgi:hypothetical protein